MPVVDFNYELSWARKEVQLDAKEVQRIGQTLQMIPDDVETVLDAGCGDGRVLACLADRYRVVGVDVSYSALAREENRGRVVGVLSQLPFPDEAFDLVLVSEVIEHIPDYALPNVLAEVRRVSRKYVLVTVPYRETLEEASVRCRCGLVFHKWGHLRRYDEETLRLLYPDMAIRGVEHLGPAKPADPAWLKRIGQRWGTFAAPDQDTVCPQCGSQLFDSGGNNLLFRVLSYTGALAGRILPRRRATWVGGLFQKPVSEVSLRRTG